MNRPPFAFGLSIDSSFSDAETITIRVVRASRAFIASSLIASCDMLDLYSISFWCCCSERVREGR
ncbi:hypothetical protein D3C83_278920 [compost metagenome]